MSNQNPEDTLAHLRTGGEAALAEFFTRHRDRLRQVVERRMNRRLSRRVDASDILQEGFVDAARRLDGFLQEPALPLLQWLQIVLTRRVIASYRRHFHAKKRDARLEQSSGHAPWEGSQRQPTEVAAGIGTPSAIASLAEQRLRLDQAISHLEPLDQEIIWLRHVEQLNNVDIAARLDLSVSAASKRYVRALARLRNQCPLSRHPEDAL